MQLKPCVYKIKIHIFAGKTLYAKQDLPILNNQTAMRTVTNIRKIDLGHLNLSEYTNFMNRVLALVNASGADKLGITTDELAAFQTDVELLNKLLKQSQANELTIQLRQLDRQRKSMVAYIASTIRNSAQLPMESMRQAGQALKLPLKPYVGIARQPAQQRTAQINSLLRDLGGDMATHMETLGLADMAEHLQQTNDLYAIMTDRRTATEAAGRLESSPSARPRINLEYDTLAQIAFATNLLHPTAETAAFVRDLNATIAETKARYNLRKAQAATAEEPDSRPQDSTTNTTETAETAEA